MIKCPNKSNLGEKGLYFSSQFHDTVCDSRWVKAVGTWDSWSYHTQSQSRVKWIHICSVAWLYTARFLHSSKAQDTLPRECATYNGVWSCHLRQSSRDIPFSQPNVDNPSLARLVKLTKLSIPLSDFWFWTELLKSHNLWHIWLVLKMWELLLCCSPARQTLLYKCQVVDQNTLPTVSPYHLLTFLHSWMIKALDNVYASIRSLNPLESLSLNI